MTETSKPGHAYVLGIDPGTTTGLALVYLPPGGRPHLVWQDQRPWFDAGNVIEATAQHLAELAAAPHEGAPAAVIACEKFTLNANSAKRGQKPAEDAMGMIGVARRAAGKYGVPFAKTEQASAAKTLISDQVLRRLGLYAVGMKHANDATRHALLQAVKRGWMDKNLLAPS